MDVPDYRFKWPVQTALWRGMDTSINEENALIRRCRIGVIWPKKADA